MRRLLGYGAWCCKESDMIVQISTAQHHNFMRTDFAPHGTQCVSYFLWFQHVSFVFIQAFVHVIYNLTVTITEILNNGYIIVNGYINVNCEWLHNHDSKGNQSWIFIGRTYAKAEIPILWPPDAKNWLIWKDPDAGKDGGREEKGMTEDGWMATLTQRTWVWASSRS